MTMPSDLRNFRLVVAFLLLVGAAVAMYFAQRSPHIRYWGLAAIVIAMGLVRSSSGSRSIEQVQNGPPPLSSIHWVVGVILAGLTIGAHWLLNWAAQNSPSSTWTVYAYAGTGIVAIVYWLTILARHRERGTRWPWQRAT
jgi:hypothetical protein